MEIKRCVVNEASQAIVEAMEHADDIEMVLILCQGKPERDSHVFHNDSLKISDAIYLMEKFKLFLLQEGISNGQ